jgi:hypothetical protein
LGAPPGHVQHRGLPVPQVSHGRKVAPSFSGHPHPQFQRIFCPAAVPRRCPAWSPRCQGPLGLVRGIPVRALSARSLEPGTCPAVGPAKADAKALSLGLVRGVLGAKPGDCRNPVHTTDVRLTAGVTGCNVDQSERDDIPRGSAAETRGGRHSQLRDPHPNRPIAGHAALPRDAD